MAELVHATAIVVGTTGLAIVGPSGAGKSTLAIRLIAEARQAGHFAALLSDDQIFVEAVNGRVVASAPATIKGMIEVHGSGIGRLETIETAVLQLAVRPVESDSSTRIPEENQHFPLIGGLSLPLIFLDRGAPATFARLSALMPGFPVSGAFKI